MKLEDEKNKIGKKYLKNKTIGAGPGGIVRIEYGCISPPLASWGLDIIVGVVGVWPPVGPYGAGEEEE